MHTHETMGSKMKFKRILQLTTNSLFILIFVLLCTNRALASEADGGNRCSGISLVSAAAILGVSADNLQENSSDLMVSPDDIEKKIYKILPYNCTIRSKSNFLQFITYVTYFYNDTGQARIEFDKMRKGFESISKVDVVSDIGDASFWAGDDRFQRMVAMKGNVVIDVLSPKDFNRQKRIISLVLDNFITQL